MRYTKTAGQNDGQVKMYLASVLGVLPADVSATSVAMITFPQGVGPGALKPRCRNQKILWINTCSILKFLDKLFNLK